MCRGAISPSDMDPLSRVHPGPRATPRSMKGVKGGQLGLTYEAKTRKRGGHDQGGEGGEVSP